MQKLLNINAESERVRRTIPFETLQYGATFTNETFDIYGIDLPKGTKLLYMDYFFFFSILVALVSIFV